MIAAVKYVQLTTQVGFSNSRQVYQQHVSVPVTAHMLERHYTYIKATASREDKYNSGVEDSCVSEY